MFCFVGHNHINTHLGIHCKQGRWWYVFTVNQFILFSHRVVVVYIAVFYLLFFIISMALYLCINKK